MNKSQLVSTIADSMEISGSTAELTLSAVLNCIVDNLTKCGAISLFGWEILVEKHAFPGKYVYPQNG